MGRRAKLADRPPPRQMGMGRWFDTPAERRADATGRPNSCQSWAQSISRGRRQCLSLNFRYRTLSGPSRVDDRPRQLTRTMNPAWSLGVLLLGGRHVVILHCCLRKARPTLPRGVGVIFVARLQAAAGGDL